jgi:hypothetical protein
MKLLKLLAAGLSLALFIGCADKASTFADLITDETPIYHIQGFKDKRIRALFSATFKSTANLDNDKCGYTDRNTNLRRAILMDRMYLASDENYELKIPIILNDNQNNCNFQFIGLELDLRRISGEEIDTYYYSRFMLLLNRQKNDLTVYEGHGAGQSANSDIVEMPPTFITDKKYFRVAPDTSFLCRTEWRDWSQEKEPSGGFYCAMKINGGDTKFYPKNEIGTRVTNPQFGVDEIVSSNLTINIIADDNGSIAYYEDKMGKWTDRFREYIPPKKSIFQKLFD